MRTEKSFRKKKPRLHCKAVCIKRERKKKERTAIVIPYSFFSSFFSSSSDETESKIRKKKNSFTTHSVFKLDWNPPLRNCDVFPPLFIHTHNINFCSSHVSVAMRKKKRRTVVCIEGRKGVNASEENRRR